MFQAFGPSNQQGVCYTYRFQPKNFLTKISGYGQWDGATILSHLCAPLHEKLSIGVRGFDKCWFTGTRQWSLRGAVEVAILLKGWVAENWKAALSECWFYKVKDENDV